MSNYLIAYAGAVAVLFVIDMVLRGELAKAFFRNALGHLLLPQPHMTAAVQFYALFVVAIVIFSVSLAIAADSWAQTLPLAGYAAANAIAR